MFLKAKYEVRAMENDFPVIGDIGETEINGKDCSLIVKEIIGLEWKKDTNVPTLIVRVIVEISDNDLLAIENKNMDKSNKVQGKFHVIEGGRKRTDN